LAKATKEKAPTTSTKSSFLGEKMAHCEGKKLEASRHI
jgi:hypothetical protein